MRVPRASLSIFVVLFAACGQDRLTGPPAAAPSLGFSLSVQISEGSRQLGPGLPSPLRVQLSVRDASGGGVPIVGGDLVVRDLGDAPLAQALVPGSSGGHASVELLWPQAALARRLDVRLNVLDSSGVAHTVEHALTL